MKKKGAFRARSNLDKFPTCERDLKTFSTSKKQLNTKAAVNVTQ